MDSAHSVNPELECTTQFDGIFDVYVLYQSSLYHSRIYLHTSYSICLVSTIISHHVLPRSLQGLCHFDSTINVHTYY